MPSAFCDRVAIHDHRRIMALDSLATLIWRLGTEERGIFSRGRRLIHALEKSPFER